MIIRTVCIAVRGEQVDRGQRYRRSEIVRDVSTPLDMTESAEKFPHRQSLPEGEAEEAATTSNGLLFLSSRFRNSICTEEGCRMSILRPHTRHSELFLQKRNDYSPCVGVARNAFLPVTGSIERPAISPTSLMSLACSRR